MPDRYSHSSDKTMLVRAWTNYYTKMGLAYNKLNHKVYERVQKGKFPNK